MAAGPIAERNQGNVKIYDPYLILLAELLAYVTHKSTRNALSLCSHTISHKSLCFIVIRFGELEKYSVSLTLTRNVERSFVDETDKSRCFVPFIRFTLESPYILSSTTLPRVHVHIVYFIVLCNWLLD